MAHVNRPRSRLLKSGGCLRIIDLIGTALLAAGGSKDHGDKLGWLSALINHRNESTNNAEPAPLERQTAIQF
jgi:hypothetical protein